MQEKTIHIVFQVINFLFSEASNHLKLSDSEKLLLINLASHKGVKGIYPSVRTIARELKKGESSVRRFISGLKTKGLILIDPVKGKSNHYTIVNLSTTPLNSERGIDTDPSQFREDPPLTSERGTPLNIEKVITKSNNKGRKEREREPRAHTLPVDFVVSKKSTQAILDMGFTPENREEILDKFIEYYTAKGNKMVDWQPIVVRWFQSERKSETPNTPQSGVRGVLPPVRGVPEWNSDHPSHPDHKPIGQFIADLGLMAKQKLNGKGDKPHGLGREEKGERKDN